MNMGRRGLLKLMGAAPAIAATAPALATQAAGYAVPGLMAGASFGSQPGANPPMAPSLKSFTTFVSFMKDRESEWRRECKRVSSVDPDIASMRLPLATKCRMQAERDFERVKENQRSWFERQLSLNGKVEVW